MISIAPLSQNEKQAIQSWLWDMLVLCKQQGIPAPDMALLTRLVNRAG